MADPPAPFGAVAALAATHDLSSFQSGEADLDDWLRRRALANRASGASSTYVVCASATPRLVGFYALSMGQIVNRDVVGTMRRNMPQQIHAVVLGRLAVDLSCQGYGLGAALLRDAVLRAARAAGEVAARVVLVHAISPAAEAFYRHHGFVRLPVATPTLALDLAAWARAAGDG